MRAPKILDLPRPKELKSNKVEDIQDFFRRIIEEFDRAYKLLKDDMESGGWQTAHWRITEDSNENLKHQYRASKTDAWADRAPKLESSP